MRFGQKIRLFGIQVKAFQRLVAAGLQVTATCYLYCLLFKQSRLFAPLRLLLFGPGPPPLHVNQVSATRTLSGGFLYFEKAVEEGHLVGDLRVTEFLIGFIQSGHLRTSGADIGVGPFFVHHVRKSFATTHANPGNHPH